MIDAGADLLVGHGPHLLRGLELYKGSYERFRAEPDLTPGQVYQHAGRPGRLPG